jgi:hypothetical protein
VSVDRSSAGPSSDMTRFSAGEGTPSAFFSDLIRHLVSYRLA